MPPSVKNLLKRNEELKRKKQYWYPVYQALAQFVLLRKQYFTNEPLEGPFLLNRVFDATAPHAAHLTASSILGQIWPNPFESFEFVPQVAQEEEVYTDAFEMMQTVNEVLPTNLAAPEAGVMPAIHESILDALVFGVGAVYPIETGDLSLPVRVKAVDAKTMAYEENEAGQVDTVYMERQYTIAQLVQRFGYANCSKQSCADYEADRLDKKVKVLHVIEPRRERNPLKLGMQDAPWSSTHIEVAAEHLLLESGFNEMPIIVFRFWKNVGEVQGRSPAMDALPDIRALNKLVEMFELAGEMSLDPPKMISSEDVLGAGKIQWGPGAWIPVNSMGRVGSDRGVPVQPIIDVQNPGWAIQRISDLRQNIMEYFMLDRMTDLNNTSRQTLGEANIRNELRMYITGPVLNRILVELVTPLLDRSFNIMLELGLFGVVQGSQQDMALQMAGIQPKYLSADFIQGRMGGLKGYRLNFISPAARLMKQEEALGTQKLTEYALAVAPVAPEVLDNIDFNESLRAVQRLSGASQTVLRSPAAVERIRKMRAQAQQQEAERQQQLQAMQVGSEAIANAAKGVKDVTGAA